MNTLQVDFFSLMDQIDSIEHLHSSVFFDDVSYRLMEFRT